MTPFVLVIHLFLFKPKDRVWYILLFQIYLTSGFSLSISILEYFFYTFLYKHSILTLWNEVVLALRDIFLFLYRNWDRVNLKTSCLLWYFNFLSTVWHLSTFKITRSRLKGKRETSKGLLVDCFQVLIILFSVGLHNYTYPPPL